MTYTKQTVNIIFNNINLLNKIQNMVALTTSNELQQLSPTDAKKIILMCESYLSSSPLQTSRQHRTALIAKQMEAAQKYSLASKLMDIHEAMESVKKGHYKELDIFTDTSISADLVASAKDTEFAKHLEPVIGLAKGVDKVLNFRCIDWEKSRDTLINAKKEYWPTSLTMVEKLNSWQRQKNNVINL